MAVKSAWTMEELRRFDSREYEPPLGEPCGARPGSNDRIETMRRRVEQGQAVFHPMDATDLLLRENKPRRRTAC